VHENIFLYSLSQAVKRDAPNQIVMQRNTAKIMEEMNYEEAEPYLVTYDIITLDERRKLYKEKSQDQIWYVIEKVSKGTKEAFYNFLKALEESKDDANHELMIHLQGQSTPLCQSEMLNTPDNSIQDELRSSWNEPNRLYNTIIIYINTHSTK